MAQPMTKRTLDKCLHPVYNSSLVFLLAEIYRLQAFIYKEEFLIDKTMYKSSQGIKQSTI